MAATNPSTDPDRLRAVVDALPDRLWVHAIGTVERDVASAVAAVRDGRATTKSLPARIAARVAATLDHEIVSAALAGETRTTVLAAVAAPQTEDAGSQLLTNQLPAPFRGNLDEVVAKLKKRKTLTVSDALAGLAGRGRDDAARLVAAVVARVHVSSRFELVLAAATGALPLSAMEVAQACSQYQNSYWSLESLDAAIVLGDTDVYIDVAHAVYENSRQSAGSKIPSAAMVDRLVEDATAWSPAARCLAAAVVVGAGRPWSQIAPLALDAPAINRARWAAKAPPHVAERFARTFTVADVAAAPAYDLAQLVACCGPLLDIDVLTASFTKLAAADVVRLLAAEVPAPLDVATVELLLDTMATDPVRQLYSRAAALLDKGASMWSNGRIPRVRALDSTQLVPLLAAVGREYGWRRLWEGAPKHRAAAAALGVLIADAFERHAPDGARPEHLALIAETIDDFSGSLDELVGTCVTLAA